MAQRTRTIKLYPQQCEDSGVEQSLKQLLRQTAGSWREGDGLAYQQAVRSEWKENREPSGS